MIAAGVVFYMFGAMCLVLGILLTAFLFTNVSHTPEKADPMEGQYGCGCALTLLALALAPVLFILADMCLGRH